jgi:hypothetical protein
VSTVVLLNPSRLRSEHRDGSALEDMTDTACHYTPSTDEGAVMHEAQHLRHLKVARRVLLHPKGCMPQSNFQISYSLPAISASKTVEATKYEAV